MNLTALEAPATDIGYNALYTSDEALITFLNSKDPDWAATQTIAPTGITATSLDNAVIMVSWLPITYTDDTGGYKVMMSETAGGPYTLAGQTENKTTSSLNVTSLTPGTRYYFVVQTHTNSSSHNRLLSRARTAWKARPSPGYRPKFKSRGRCSSAVRLFRASSWADCPTGP